MKNILLQKMFYILPVAYTTYLIYLLTTFPYGVGKKNILLVLILSITSFFLTRYYIKNFQQPQKKLFKKTDCIFLLLIIGIFFLFTYQHLGEFFTVDEYKWLYKRIPQYIEAWKTHNWHLTLINDKPGILPTWLTSLLFEKIDFIDQKPTSSITEIADMLRLWRLPIIIFNSLSLIPLYFSVKKLLGSIKAKGFLLLIISTPILIGISQIVNPDATLWITVAIAMTGYIVAIEKKSFIWEILSGFYLGLAVLSKYFSIIAILVLIIFTFLKIFTSQEINIKPMWVLARTSLVTILTTTLLAPVIIIEPNTLLDLTFTCYLTKDFGIPLLILIALSFLLLFLLRNTKYKLPIDKIKIFFLTSLKILLLCGFIYAIVKIFLPNQGIPYTELWLQFGKKNTAIFSIFAGSFLIQLWTNTLGIVLLFFFTLFKKEKSLEYLDAKISLCIFILAMLIGPSIGGLITVPRYEIMLYPMIIFFVILSFKHLQDLKYIILTSLIFLTNLISIFLNIPFTYTYQNILSEITNINVTEPWGFGGYEVAEIITENIPSEATIWTDREGICIFLKNHCRIKEMDPFDSNYNFDYIILSEKGKVNTYNTGRLQYNEQMRETWRRYYTIEEPVYEVSVNNNSLMKYKILRIDNTDKY